MLIEENSVTVICQRNSEWLTCDALLWALYDSGASDDHERPQFYQALKQEQSDIIDQIFKQIWADQQSVI